MQKRYQVLFVMGIFSIITYLDRLAISVTGASITSELKLTEIEFGWILGAFSFAYAAFEIPTGYMGDRIGPRRVLIRIVLWWSLFTIFTGFSYSFTSLMVLRFLFGMGEAGAYPNATVAISRWFPITERGRAQSIIWMSSRIGGALAPILATFIMLHFGWRWVFYIYGASGILWVIFWTFWFKDEPRDMPGISDKEVEKIESERAIKSASHKMLSWKTFVFNSNLWALMLMYHCLLYGAHFYLSWMPKYLKQGRHIPAAELAFMAALPFILGAFGCLIGGFSSDYLSKKYGVKFGRRFVGMAGLLLSGVCMISATFISNNGIAIVLLSLGLAFKDFTLPVAWAAANDIGGEHSGSISGAMGTIGQLGATIMSVAFGYILTATSSWEYPIQIIGVIVIIGGLLWFKIDASKKIVVYD